MKNYNTVLRRLFACLSVLALTIPAFAVPPVGPTIVTPPHDITAPLNGATNFTVVVSGTPPFSYKWKQDTHAPVVGGSTFNFSPVADSQAGSYVVIVTDGSNLSVTSAPPAVFHITHPPVISSQPDSLVALAQDDVVFDVGVNGSTPFTFAWNKNGNNIPLETNSTIEIPSVTQADAGSYSVFISNIDGQTNTVPGLLSVVASQFISTQPLIFPLNKCSSLALTANVAGAGDDLHYRWLHNGNPVGTDSPTYTVSTSLAPSDDGVYSVTITNDVTFDNNGVTTPLSSATVTASILVIDPPPVITGFPTNITLTTAGATPVCGQIATWVEPVASDNCAVTNFTSDHASGDLFPVGVTTVTYTANDDAGQVTTSNFTVTVIDDTPPTVLTKDITINLDASGNASIVPAQVDNGSTDNCAIATSSVFPNTFNCANVGPNTVTLTVVDIHGNTNTGTATVTVKDVTPPTVVTKDITIDLDHSGNATISASDVNNGSSDTCGIASMTVRPSSFNSGNIGPNTVTLCVTDVNGNKATGTATVTVVDNTPPDVTTQNITVQLDSTGNASITGTSVDNGSFDAGGIASRVVSPSTFTCGNVGDNTVTLTVTDNSGNTNSATATVTVQDSLAPSVSFNTITVQLDDHGNYTFTPSDVSTISSGSTDNCGIQGVTIDPTNVNFTDVGSKSVTITVTDIHGNSAQSSGNITVLAPINPPNPVYVDASYGDSGAVSFPNSGGTGTYYIGFNAFPTIQGGVSSVATNGTVHVAAGGYFENVNITTPLCLLGPNAGICATNASRGPEAVIYPAVSGPDAFGDDSIVVYVAANKVKIDGFTIDGDNTNLTSGVLVGTNDVDAAEGIASFEGICRVSVENNIIKNIGDFGMDFDNYYNGHDATSDNFIHCNYLTNIGNIGYGFGIGILIQENFYACVTGNTMDQVRLGVQTWNYNQFNPGPSASIVGNTISSASVGVYHNLQYQSASAFTIANNTISSYDEATSGFWRGILIKSLQDSSSVVITNNAISSGTITRDPVGYMIWNVPTTNSVAIVGGSVTGAKYGVFFNNYDGDNSPGDPSTLILRGVSISGSTGAGVYVKDNPLNTDHSAVCAVLTNGVSINGGPTGILVDGCKSFVAVNNTYLTLTTNYLVLTNGSKNQIDATAVSFDGLLGTDCDLDELYTIEDKITHKVDDASLGFVRVLSSNVFVTVNSYVAPNTTKADIQRGIDAAHACDIVNVDAGTYCNNLTVCRPVTLLGADAGIDPRIIVEPSIPGPGGRGLETIIDGGNNDTALAITANLVTVDGFTVKRGANGSHNAGIWLAACTHSNTVVNNIFTRNGAGVSVGSDDFSTISTNVFVANCNAGICGSTTTNLLIGDNEFKAHDGANPIVLTASGLNAHVGLTITRNSFHDNTNATAISALGMTGGTISSNDLSELGGACLAFSGGNHDVTVNNNNFTNALRGITVQDTALFSGCSPNSGLTIVDNSFTGFTNIPCPNLYAVANLPGGDSDRVLCATANWWGDISGAYSASFNPYGLGGGVTDHVKVSPWLADGTDTSTDIGFQPNPTLQTPPTHLIFSTEPGDGILSQPLSVQPVVTVLDASNNVTPWVNLSVTLSIGNNPSNATLIGTSVMPAVSGLSTFTNVGLTAGGGPGYTLIAKAPDLICANSTSFTVFIPPTIYSQPSSLTRNAGENARFCVAVSGSTPFTYQWLKNGNAMSDSAGHITGANTSSLLLCNVLKADQATYTVVITNVAGSVTSCLATLTVIDPYISTDPQSLTAPLGSVTNLFVVATGTQPLHYQWIQNGFVLVGKTNSVLNFNPTHDSDAGTYYMVVTNSAGSATSGTAVVTIIHPPNIISQPTNLFLAVGRTGTFSVSANGNFPFTYQWYKNGNSLSPSGTAKKLILSNIQLSDSGSYYVAITNSDGSATSQTATLTVYDKPTITVQPVCQTNDAGTTVVFSVSATSLVPISYQWLKGGTNLANGGKISGVLTTNLTITNVLGGDAGFYSVSVSNSVGAILSDPALLTVNDPVITQQPTNIVVVQDRTAVFKVKAAGTNLRYEWVVDGFDLDDETNSTLSLSNVSDSDQGHYWVVVTSDYGSVTSCSATLITTPPIIITQPQDDVVLIGQVAHFSVSANGAEPLTYQWFKNGNAITDETNHVLNFFVSSVEDSGSYSVLVTTAVGGYELSQTAVLVVSGEATARVVPVSFVNGVFTVGVTGIDGYTYILQGSTNMQIWYPVVTNVSPFTYADPTAVTNRVQMFRALFAPPLPPP